MQKYGFSSITTQELLNSPEKAVEILGKIGVQVKLGEPKLKGIKDYSIRITARDKAAAE